MTFKIRNAEIRNNNISHIVYINYNNDDAWSLFLESFSNAHMRELSTNNIVLSKDFKGYILMYTDTLLNNKLVIETDTDTIYQTILG